jgi:BirA family biotin operon repressor/biotin-[acetyl-CoA-carboxylase] ligase
MTCFQSTIFNSYCQALTTQTGRFQTDRLHLHFLDQTDSTNRVAWEILTQHDRPQQDRPQHEYPQIFLVIADRQTAGRGQWGRSWQSELGGLYLSLGISNPPHLPIPLDRLGLMPFFSAWGVAQGLHQHHIPVSLKWPNDLLLNRQKLGGILVESRCGYSNLNQTLDQNLNQNLNQNLHQKDLSQKESNPGIVIGIGLNWQNDPPERAIALDAYQQQNHLDSIECLEHLAAIVLDGLIWGYQLASNPQTSLVDFIQQYDSVLADRGAWISTGSEVGKILGITSTGALRVDINGVEQTFLPGTLRLGL